MRGLRISQRTVGGDGLDAEARGEALQAIAATAEAPARQSHGVHHMGLGECIGDLQAATAKFFAEE